MYRGVVFSFGAGLIGLGIALFFAYIGIFGGEALGETPPVMVRAILLLFGLPFTYLSLLAMKHAVMQALARANAMPVTVKIAVQAITDSDTTTYELHIRTGERRWIAPAYGGRGVSLLLSAGPGEGLAWFDQSSGLPLSVQFSGHWITTYPRVVAVTGPRCLV